MSRIYNAHLQFALQRMYKKVRKMCIFRLSSDWQLLKAVFTSHSNIHTIEFLFVMGVVGWCDGAG